MITEVDKAKEVGFDAAILAVQQLLREKQARFTRVGHPAAINKARLLEELLQEVGALTYETP